MMSSSFFFRPMGYTCFICYDQLPTVNNGKSNPKCDTREDFLNALEESYGSYTVSPSDPNALFFARENLTYHINCDANGLNPVPAGDIFLAGFRPSRTSAWWPTTGRTVFLSCWGIHLDEAQDGHQDWQWAIALVHSTLAMTAACRLS
jgi:hypothetical protein